MSVVVTDFAIGWSNSFGMDGDDSVFSYTVPANHTLICYRKICSGGGVWAINGTGDFSQFNGWWSGAPLDGYGTGTSCLFHNGTYGGEEIDGGDNVITPSWSHRYCLNGFNGTGTYYDGDQPHHSASYGWMWVITDRLLNQTYVANNLTYELMINSPAQIICYVTQSTQNFDRITMTRFNTNYSGTPPTFVNTNYSTDYLEEGLMENNTLRYRTIMRTNDDDDYFKEVFHSGEKVEFAGSYGNFALYVLLLDANGKPANFWDSYWNAVTMFQ